MATGGPSETGSASDTERGTDETFDNLCSTCSRRKKNTEGSKYCKGCKEYFCSNCVNWHNEFSALRDHQILDNVKFMQVKNSKKYSMSEKSDNFLKNFINSICELDDGTVILSDSNQRKLKRLDSSYMVRDSCIVPQNPYQVCTISSQEVALSCYNAKLIQFVFIGLTMQMTRQIETDFDCEGLAYNDKKLFISDDNTSVYVYTLTGDRLQQLKYPQLKPSLKPSLLQRILMLNNYRMMTHITVSSDGSTIFISHNQKGLIILKSNGQVVGEFTEPKLTGTILNVCLYKNNSVLVCGWDSNNVLQYTPDGKLIGEVLKTDGFCVAVCYCKKTSKLIVGLAGGIEVYDIKE